MCFYWNPYSPKKTLQGDSKSQSRDITDTGVAFSLGILESQFCSKFTQKHGGSVNVEQRSQDLRVRDVGLSSGYTSY